MATSSTSALRQSGLPGGTPPPGTVRAKISQLNASSSSIDTSRSRSSSVSSMTPPAMVSQRDTPNLSDSSHLRLTGSTIKTPRLEKDVRLVVDTRLRQHLSNLYKAEKDVPSADDVSDTEKLLAVMHSKNVNFTQEAIKIIIHLMALEENQQAIGRSVLLLELIRSLSAPQDAIRTYAAWALSNFSSNENNHKAIHDVGGIKALISVLGSASDDALKQALSALLNISSNHMFVESIRKNGGLRELIRLLEYSGNIADSIIPLTLMVFINLATNEKNMEMFGDTGGFPPLIRLLHHPVYGMDAMPFLISLLSNPRRQNQFIAAEGLRPLFDFVSRAPAKQEGKYDNSLEHCLLAIHHLLGNDDYVRMVGERNFVLPLTALLDARQDPRILVLVIEIIDTLLDSDERNGTQLVTSAGIERLIALLPSKRPKRTFTVVVDNALLLFTGLLETNDNNQEHVLARGVVPAVAGVMSWATGETLEHALHLIALLTSGINGQVVYHEIAQSWPQVLPRLLQMLSSDPANKRLAGVADSTRIKIALCFSALLSHIDCQLDLVELEVVGHFIDLLVSPNQRLQFYAITGLRNLSTYYSSVRREIQHMGGLAELLVLVHGPGRAAVSVARLEAMHDPVDLQEFCETSVPVLLAVLATIPPSRDDITRAVAKRKQRLSNPAQQDPNSNKITSHEMQQVREEARKARPDASPPSDAGSGTAGVSGNPGNTGNAPSSLVPARVARLASASSGSSLSTNGRGSRVSNMGSMGSGALETRSMGNVGSVGSGSSRVAISAVGIGLGGDDLRDADQEEDRLLEERVFQTKWENDCLIKAYTAITLQNLSIEVDFVDVVHAAGGLAVVLEHLLGSTSPRLQYEAVRLFTVWAAQDANRLAFQEMGGILRLQQALAAFKSSPVPNDALITYTQIALNTMRVPPVELSEPIASLEDDDDSALIGWEPETAILDHMRQVEHAIRAIEVSNPLQSHHSHSLPTSPKYAINNRNGYSSQPVTLRRTVRQKERYDKFHRGMKDHDFFNSEGKDSPSTTIVPAAKAVGWHEDVQQKSQLVDSNGQAIVSPTRLLFDQMEEMRHRMSTGESGVGDLTSFAPISPSRDRTRGGQAEKEKNEYGKASKIEETKENQDDSSGEEEGRKERKPQRRGSLRQLSKQFSSTLKKIRDQATHKKAKADNEDAGNETERPTEGKKKKKISSEKKKTKKKKKEKDEKTKTKKKKKKATSKRKKGLAKADSLGDGKEAFRWTVEEVGDWLEENALGELRPVFAKNQIDGKTLMQLHHAALSRMGVVSPSLSSALLQRRRKLLTRSTSLTAPPSDSSLASSLSSSRSYPSLSSSSSSSVSVQGRDKIVKDEEKRRTKKKKKRSKNKGVDEKAGAKDEEKEKKRKEDKQETKKKKSKKESSKKKRRRKKAGEEEASTSETASVPHRPSSRPTSPRGATGGSRPTSPRSTPGGSPPSATATAKPRVSSLRIRPSGLGNDVEGKGKERLAAGDSDGDGGNAASENKSSGGSAVRRKELRFEGNVPTDEDDETHVALIDLKPNGDGEELLVLRDIRISLLEERNSKNVTGSASSAAEGSIPGADGGDSQLRSGKSGSAKSDRKRGGSMRRRKQREQHRQQASSEKEPDEAQNVKNDAGTAPAAAPKAAPEAQPKQAGFLRSISTIFHIRGHRARAASNSKQRDPHDVGPSQPPPAATAAVDKDDDGEGGSGRQVEEKKRGSWVRSAFMRRGRKAASVDGEGKNVIKRGRSEEDAELRSSKEIARRQHKEQKEERERKKKQDKEKTKERNKLSRKSPSLLSRMAVSTKRGNQGSKKTMTFSLDEDVNYGSTTDTTTTHSHSRGRGDDGDMQEDDDEEENNRQGTPRVTMQRVFSDDLVPADMEGSAGHVSYSETEEQEVADYSEVVHQTTMDSGSYPSTPKRGSSVKTNPRLQLVSLLAARLQIIAQLGPHRKRLMLDLLETERRYVALLTVLIRQFLKPLLLLTYTDQEQFLTEEEVHSIFLNVSLLHSYNMIFLSNLTQRVRGWSDTQSVADVFLMMSDFLSAYGEYLHNFEAATALLQHCLQDPSFDQFVQTLAASPDCEGLALEDFLILPYQRVTAYTHIFRKLVRWTWESHEDYGNSGTVLDTMEQIISANLHLRLLHSPKDKRSGQTSAVAAAALPQTPRSRYAKLSAREGFLKLLAVHDILIGCPIDITITPGRQYVCEAQVTLLDESVNRQSGWLYLFNDALLTTTEIEIAVRKTFPPQNKDAQDFCSFIPLEDIMTIDEAMEYSTIVKVTCREGRIITIKFDSTENKSLWLDHFVVIVAAHRQKTARFNPLGDGGDKPLMSDDAVGPVPHSVTSEESEFESV